MSSFNVLIGIRWMGARTPTRYPASTLTGAEMCNDRIIARAHIPYTVLLETRRGAWYTAIRAPWPFSD